MVSRGFPMAAPMYLSTHNALRVSELEYPKFDVTFYEMKEYGMGKENNILLSISPLHDVQTVKRLLIKHSDLPSGTQVKDIRITYKGVDLPNYRLMNLFCSSTRKLYWSFIKSTSNGDIREMGFKLPKRLQCIVKEVRLAFHKNISPKLSMDGTGGTYFLFNINRHAVAIFKPSDEEAFAPCNPRGYEGEMNQRGFRAGVLSSEGASREAAAFLLDASSSNFCGVPETSMVECCHENFCYPDKSKEKEFTAGVGLRRSSITWKAGSLQEFVDAKECCGNFDACLFSIQDVHRIGILDIRVMNLDRNDGNILVTPISSPRDGNASFSSRSPFALSSGRLLSQNPNNHPLPLPSIGEQSGGDNEKLESTTVALENPQTLSTGLKRKSFPSGLQTPDGKLTRYRLIPIDHGLILPDVMDVANIDLVWFNWPQSKIPFDETELYSIFSLDPDKDAERLKRKLFIRDECLRTMRVSTRLLQYGAEMHLNLCQLAEISCRENIDEPSPLEKLVKEAIASAYRAVHHSSVMGSQRLVFAMDLAVGSVPRFSLPKSKAVSRSNKKDFPEDSCLSTVQLEDKPLQQPLAVKPTEKSCNSLLPTSPVTPATTENNLSSSPLDTLSPLPPFTPSSCLSYSFSESSSSVFSSSDSDIAAHDEDLTPLVSSPQTTSFPPSTCSQKTSSPSQGILQPKHPTKSTISGSVSFSPFHETFSSQALTPCFSIKRGSVVAASNSAESSIQTISKKGALTEHSFTSPCLPVSASSFPSPPTSSPPSGNASSLPHIPHALSSSSITAGPFSDSPSSQSSTSREKERMAKLQTVAFPTISSAPHQENKIETTLSTDPEKRCLNASMAISSLPSSALFDYPKRKPKKIRDKKTFIKGEFPVAENSIAHITTLPSTEDLSTVGRGTRMSTARRLNGTAVRGTTYRQQIQENNTTWTLQDEKGHQIPIDWSSRQFDKKFFEAFEGLLRKYIAAQHPNWREYAFFGDIALEEVARSNAKWKKKQGFSFLSKA